jgi:hypothetical protein
MDANAKLDAALGWKTGVALAHAVLQLDGAAHSIDGAPELDENAISRPLNDAAVMQSDGGVEQITAERPQPRKRLLLIGTGKLAVSDYVRRKNRREFSGLRHDSTLGATFSLPQHGASNERCPLCC